MSAFDLDWRVVDNCVKAVCICLALIQLIHAGKGEAIRIRAILRSLIPLEDLEGVISIPFSMPTLAKGMTHLIVYFKLRTR